MRRLILLVVGICVALCAAPTATAERQEPYPVNYNFLQNAAMYGALPAAPGQNIWTCKPSKAHPRPVVLVHGTAGSAAGNWGTLSAVLANEGYCVFALTYGLAPALADFPIPVGGMNRMQASARELRAFVAKVLRATGSTKVDLVGHSQGTLMPNYYVKFLGGARYVKRYVSLSSLWQGALTPAVGELMTMANAYGLDPSKLLPVAKAAPQSVAGSPFMTKMRAGGVAVRGVKYTNIVSKYDEVVFPYTLGIQTGMQNIVLQDRCALDFSDHVQIPSSPNVMRIVLNTLDPAHAKPVDCRLVLPVLGLSG